MLSITLACVGKMRETYYISAFAEYAKRLGAYCRFDLVELPEQRLPERPSQKEIHAALEKEAQAIRAVQQALADSLAMLNEKAPNDQVLKLKALEAMQKVADGKATKIIIPSEMQGLVGLANGIVEGTKE